jgi:hypothetical protein
MFTLVACGSSKQAAGPTTTSEPPPPLHYGGPVAQGAVPAWLERVKPLRGVGHWRHAVLSPDGNTLLAQWSGECEIPIAYFIPLDTRKLRPIFPIPHETTAVAWNDDGRAGVFVNGAACGGGDVRPGLYLVSLDGGREFVTDDVAEVELWQAARS